MTILVNVLKSELIPEQDSQQFEEPESPLDQAFSRNDHSVESDKEVQVTHLTPSVGKLQPMVEDFLNFQVIEETKDEGKILKKGQ